MIFSSTANEVLIYESMAIIPCFMIQKNVWLNFVVDVRNFFNTLFKGSTYRSIEQIEISAVCFLRRVLTLNNSQMQMIDLIGG